MLASLCAVKTPLQPPYDGPFEVLKRFEKYFVVKFKNRDTAISLDRLKPAFIFNDNLSESNKLDDLLSHSNPHKTTASIPVENRISSSKDNKVPKAIVTTRTGRRVNSPSRYLD